MEINALNIHNKICQIILDTFPQNAFRIDNEGYEYIDDKYTLIYDVIYNQIINYELWP